MPELQIGQTVIPYQVRYSDRARRKRIEVTPERVQIIAPEGTPQDGPDGIGAFVHAKRAWIFDAVADCHTSIDDDSPQNYVSGAKIPYRGRRLMLHIEAADVPLINITCKSRFHIQVPHHMTDPIHRQRSVRFALDRWLHERALHDAKKIAGHYARKLNVTPTDVRIADQKHLWGSCGKDGILRINWRLIRAPLAVMEYVVAHEVCHLVHRHHSEAFWQLLGGVMPDWRERKGVLEGFGE